MASVVESGQGTLWDAAVARASELTSDGYRILLVGGTAPRPVLPEELMDLSPTGNTSALADALVVVAEAGGREVRLLTDRRISDPLGVVDAGRRLGLEVQVEALPEARGNLGIDALAVPPSVESGGEALVTFDIRGDGSADSVGVVVTLDGLEVARNVVGAPRDGGATRVEVEVPVPAGSGDRRLMVTLEGDDGFSQDDERVGVLRVDPEDTGVLLVGFRPDWEPRYLFPLLREVTGLPTQGFLRIGPDLFAPLDGTDRDGVDLESVLRRIQQAQLVVLSGVDVEAVQMLQSRLAGVGRLLLMPDDPAAATLVGLDVAAPVGGEWYVGPVPPSPIAGGVSSLVGDELPPIGTLMRLQGSNGTVGLVVENQGAGQSAPALILQSQGNARTATLLAKGTWRWASRGGPAEEDYRRLWSSVAGWLLSDAPSASGLGVRPFDAIQRLGTAQRWLARGQEGDSVRLAITDQAGVTVVDSTFVVSDEGTFHVAALPVGQYAYTSVSGDASILTGQFEVEGFTDEMFKRAVDEDRLAMVGTGAGDSSGGQRPFRTSPLPYLLILAILCVEWAGRRRLGLR